MDEKTLQFLDSFDLKRIDLGLDRVEKFLEFIGNPEKGIKYVHVAGTNGKGSVSAFIASALSQAGHKTGLYLSPHLKDFNERFQINGEKASDADIQQLIDWLKKKKEESKIDLSYFEFITCLAFKFFESNKCEFVVLEVGMGGRLDATNVIEPEVSVITQIGLEHREWLGNTITEIAGEKAGIIKQGKPVVIAGKEREAVDVIEKLCWEKNCDLYWLGKDFKFEHKRPNLESQAFDYVTDNKRIDSLETSLIGEFQFGNACIAVKALELLGINEQSIRIGLKKAFVPGRFQIIHNNPFLIADVAHNPMGANALQNSLQRFFPSEKVMFLLGISEDKAAESIAKELIPSAQSIICTQAKFRGMDSLKLKAAVELAGFKGDLIVEPKMSDAVKTALANNPGILVFTGSFFSVGEALRHLNPKF